MMLLIVLTKFAATTYIEDIAWHGCKIIDNRRYIPACSPLWWRYTLLLLLLLLLLQALNYDVLSSSSSSSRPFSFFHDVNTVALYWFLRRGGGSHARCDQAAVTLSWRRRSLDASAVHFHQSASNRPGSAASRVSTPITAATCVVHRVPTRLTAVSLINALTTMRAMSATSDANVRQ